MNASTDQSPPARWTGKWLRYIRAIHADDNGATTMEYMMITVTIVLPIGLAVPLFLWMVRSYVQRFVTFMGWPFP